MFLSIRIHLLSGSRVILFIDVKLIKLDILWFQATEIHSVRRGGYLERKQYLPELLGRGGVRPPRSLQPGTAEVGTDVSLPALFGRSLISVLSVQFSWVGAH